MSMTDTGTVAPVIDSAAPAISDLLAPQPMSVEAATAKRVEMLGDEKFRSRVALGDPEATKQWKDVIRALNPPVNQATADGREFTENMNALAVLRAKADLPPEVWHWAALKGPVALHERQEALFEKERLFKDKEFVRKYLDGDRAANARLTQINLVLASKVGSFDEIEAFKVRLAKVLETNKRNTNGKG